MTRDATYAGIASFGLADVLRQHAEHRSATVATVCAGSRITWADTESRCAALASELSAAGVGVADRVLWWGQNCHRLLETLFACAELGAVVCAANWPQTASELAFVVEDSEPKVVIWQDEGIGSAARSVRAEHHTDAVWIRHDATGADSY